MAERDGAIHRRAPAAGRANRSHLANHSGFASGRQRLPRHRHSGLREDRQERRSSHHSSEVVENPSKSSEEVLACSVELWAPRVDSMRTHNQDRTKINFAKTTPVLRITTRRTISDTRIRCSRYRAVE